MYHSYKQKENGYNKEHNKLLEDHQDWERRIGSKRTEIINPIPKNQKFSQSESSFMKMLMTTFSVPSSSIMKSGRNNYQLKFFKNELTNLGIRINYLKKNNGYIKSVSCGKDGLSIIIQSGIEVRWTIIK